MGRQCGETHGADGAPAKLACLTCFTEVRFDVKGLFQCLDVNSGGFWGVVRLCLAVLPAQSIFSEDNLRLLEWTSNLFVAATPSPTMTTVYLHVEGFYS